MAQTDQKIVKKKIIVKRFPLEVWMLADDGIEIELNDFDADFIPTSFYWLSTSQDKIQEKINEI